MICPMCERTVVPGVPIRQSTPNNNFFACWQLIDPTYNHCNINMQNKKIIKYDAYVQIKNDIYHIESNTNYTIISSVYIYPAERMRSSLYKTVFETQYFSPINDTRDIPKLVERYLNLQVFS